MKFQVIVADPPWNFSDRLTMSDVKRGASANYDTLSLSDLKNLPVKDLADNDAVLALWCPSSMLKEGLEVMEAWGFRQTQTHVWVKTKKTIDFDVFSKDKTLTVKFNLSDVLAFGMGRLFRQTHEIVLIGVRGKIYSHLINKSQRSVHFGPVTKHSAKPEGLQDMMEKMFPSANKLELFARRSRPGWVCIGNECPDTLGQDIRLTLSTDLRLV